ncbi:hypothetical protein [Palleronia caenipelagi]|uniref:Uncharacterized protein n=1 Tax=Palleronia caenipelagi TaxID=2489174 RepID=A0A547PY13_9RHOB|nr:hypothetical protein [Palleronia caenipelagi]TRD18996.1 hypothetical protein FEV53_10880 [Palleronia caenipelagi]
MRGIVIGTLSAVALAGCATLGIGGNETSEPVESATLIAEIQTLAVSQTPSGAVIRATGLADRQGYHSGALVPLPDGDPSTLSYVFEIGEPVEATRVSTPRSREVTVATVVSNQNLIGVREIRVSAARNAQAVRR